MISKTITYDDLDGNRVSKEFHFHLSKADIIEYELLLSHGEEEFTDTLKKALEEDNREYIIKVVKTLIRMSVGQRQGSQFVKNDVLTSDFMNSEAYSELLVELMTNTDSLALFFTGVFPKSVSDALAAQITEAAARPVETVHNVFTEHPSEPAPEVEYAAFNPGEEEPPVRPGPKRADVFRRHEVTDDTDKRINQPPAAGWFGDLPQD